MDRLPVNFLITPAGGPGILPELESLKQSKRYAARAVLADSNPATGNMFLPGVDARYRIPECTADDFIPALLRLIEKEKIDYHYSGLDEEMPILAKHRKAFKKAGCRLLLPESEALACALDKKATEEKLRGTVRMPKTFPLNGSMDTSKIYEELEGGVLIKATGLRGGRQIYIPDDREEFDFYFERCLRLSKKSELEFIIQAYIEGTEYNVTTLHDLEHRQIFAVCRRKFENRQIKSTTTAAVVERRDDVIEQAVAAVRGLNLTPGFNNVEIIVSNADDQPYFIEVNGGRTAAQDLNLVASGINLTDLMIDVLRGEKVESIPHPEGGVVSLKIRRDVITNYSDVMEMPTPGS